MDPPKFTLNVVENYVVAQASFAEVSASINGKQPGDPKVGVKRTVNVFKGESMAEWRPMPLKMSIGKYMVHIVRKNCEAWLETV